MDPIRPLTPTQRAIAELVADGRSSRDIARTLHRSMRTIEGHIERIGLRLPGDGSVKARITRYITATRSSAAA